MHVKIALRRLICFAMSVACTLATVSSLSAQYTEANSFLNPALVVTLGTSGYSTDLAIDTAVFQQAINDVNAAGGGKVIIPRGTYELGPVTLRSEVHLVFDGHSTIRANATGFSPTTNLNLFLIGQTIAVQNVSIRSIKSATRFEFDGSHHNRTRAFRIANAANFLISNFDIVDSRTIFSGISMGWGGDNSDGTAQMPDGGTVEHIRIANAHYGYGAIQTQGSRNVSFKDIEAIGGVALRVETGFIQMNRALARAGRMESSIENVTAEDISSHHGQTALMFAPHAMHQGAVTAENITAVGSEYAVLIEEGSLHKFTDQEIIDLGVTEGSFESISVDGIEATFTAGPIETRWVHLNHYQAEFHRDGIDPSVYELPDVPAVYDHRYRGPAIAPVSNGLIGDASVSVTNITSNGFVYSPDQINDPFPDSFRGQVIIRDTTPLAGRLLGDIDDDEIWSAADLDLLFDNLGTVVQSGPFDLTNNDGVANQDDVEYWLRSIMGSEYGDANLDGRVSFLDIEIVASNMGLPGSWADGDFNNDEVVDAADLAIIEQHYAPHPVDEQLTFEEAKLTAGIVVLRGDVDSNGVVNFLDIPPFIALLTSGGFQSEADADESGAVDFLDIPRFIAILTGA